MGTVAVCSGELDAQYTPPVCDGVWVPVQWSVPFDVSTLDPQILAAAFSAGFSIVAGVWAIGWAVRQVLTLLK